MENTLRHLPAPEQGDMSCLSDWTGGVIKDDFAVLHYAHAPLKPCETSGQLPGIEYTRKRVN
jgi:hypothetical protein